MQNETKSPTSPLKFILRTLFAGLLIGILLFTAILALHDSFAASRTRDYLISKHITCPEDLNVDLHLTSWTLHIQPNTCTYQHKNRRAALSFQDPITVTLKGLQPTNIKAKSFTANLQKFNLDRKKNGPNDPKPTTSNPLLKPLLNSLLSLDPRPTADKIVLALSHLPDRKLPKTLVKKLIVEVEGTPEALLHDIDLTPPNEPGKHLSLSILQGQLATRKNNTITPKPDWFSFTELHAEITPEKIHFGGRVKIDTKTLLGSVRVPARIVADVTGLQNGDPQWTFNALPGL